MRRGAASIAEATRQRRRRIQPNPPYVLDAEDVQDLVGEVVRRSGRSGDPYTAVAEQVAGHDFERCIAILYMGEPSDPLTLGGVHTEDDVTSVVAVLAHWQLARMAHSVVHGFPIDLSSLRRPIPLTLDQYRDSVEQFAAMARGRPVDYVRQHAPRHPLINILIGSPRRHRMGYPYRAIDVLHLSDNRNALFETGTFYDELDRCAPGAGGVEGDCVRWPAAAAFLQDTLEELRGFAPRYPRP